MHDVNRKDWSWREHGKRYVKKEAGDKGVNGVCGGGGEGGGGPPGRQGFLADRWSISPMHRNLLLCEISSDRCDWPAENEQRKKII